MSLWNRIWPSRNTHRKLLENGAETRKELLQLAAAYRNDTINEVIVATDKAAEFQR